MYITATVSKQRQRQRDGRNKRVGCAAEKDVDHHHDQHERDQERELHIVRLNSRSLCERSNTGTSVIDPGKLARSSGNSAFTEFATSTAFAPACRDKPPGQRPSQAD